MNALKIKDFLANQNVSWLYLEADFMERFSELLHRNELTLSMVPESAADKMRGVKTIVADPTGRRQDSVGIVEISGVMLYSCPEWAEAWGYTGYDLIERRLDTLIQDPTVKTILLRVRSPGGMAIGAGELSERIYNARSQKKIVAYADPYAFSAAYNIASAAQSFYTIKSGMVGSVGAYMMHVDYSEMLKMEGVKVTFVKAGEKKTDGNPYEPLSDKAKADIQAQINFFYEDFVASVARNRGKDASFVKENFGKAGVVMASEALEVGMIDGILSFEQVLNMELTAIQNQNNLVQGRTSAKVQLALLELEDI